MQTRRPHIGRLAAAALGLAAFAALWLEFAPTAVGGSATYVATDGISMAPKFHTGDLVVVRRQSSYHVGEIVAYQSHFLGTLVLHRIVARDGDRFVFKGDNNDFTDPEHPRASQLVGAYLVRLPGVEARLRILRTPTALGLLVALGTVFLLGGSARRRRRRRREGRTGAPLEWFSLLALAGATTITPILVVAVIAHGRPTTTHQSTSLAYAQKGSFSYTADATWSAPYPHGRLSTGDPVFLKLVHRARFRFDYRFSSLIAHRIHGRATLTAVVRATNGWRQAIPLAARQFSGDHVGLSGVVDLRPLPKLLSRVETSSGVNASYSLVLVPHVEATGRIGGHRLAARFSPQLPFTLDEHELVPDLGDVPGKMLGPSDKGSVGGTTARAATMSFKVGSARVTTVRTWSERILAALVCALLGLALVLDLAEFSVDPTWRRHRREIVRVERIDHAGVRQIVDVPDLDTLAEIAARYDRAILHEESSDVFSVVDDGVLYRYSPPARVQPLRRVA